MFILIPRGTPGDKKAFCFTPKGASADWRYECVELMLSAACKYACRPLLGGLLLAVKPRRNFAIDSPDYLDVGHALHCTVYTALYATYHVVLMPVGLELNRALVLAVTRGACELS